MHLGYLALRTTIDEWRAKTRNPNGTVQQQPAPSTNGEAAVKQEPAGDMAPPPAPGAPNGRRREYEDHDAPRDRDVKRQRYD